MHEYSIVQALLERVDSEARSHHAVSVKRIELRVGELSGIEPELLVSAFEIAREGTLSAEATLHYQRVAARWICSSCEALIPPGGVLRCQPCDAPARLAEGDEILLQTIEMEVA